MKIRITKPVVCGGKPCAAGDVVDATDADGRYLVSKGKAELVTGEPVKKKATKKRRIKKSIKEQ